MGADHRDRRQHRARRPRPAGRGRGRLAVVTPWYPCPQRPHAGSFVRTATAAVAGDFAEVAVVNGEDWPSPGGDFRHDLVRTAHERMVGPEGTARVPVVPEATPEGWVLTRVPVPVRPGGLYAEWARAHEAALRAVLPGGRIDADVVHGHTGIYGGWAACRLARPGARVVVTEHASFLPRVLRQPASRALYGQVVERADAFLCVSPWLRERLAQSFPEHTEKFRIVPNAVDVASIPRRPERVRELRRWLFVGNLVATKGVPLLLTAFAAAVADDPTLELTLVGPGDAEAVRQQAAELGVGHQVVVRGPVEPAQVFGLMHQHDLLVHPSTFETFGMAVVEAVATGMPVLVTRCGGPEQTLAGLEGVAGRLVEVSDGPQRLLEGYRRLVAEVDQLDPVRARTEMERRFGLAAVRARLAEVYGGVVTPGPAVAPEPAPMAGPAAATGAARGGSEVGRSAAGAVLGGLQAEPGAQSGPPAPPAGLAVNGATTRPSDLTTGPSPAARPAAGPGHPAGRPPVRGAARHLPGPDGDPTWTGNGTAGGAVLLLALGGTRLRALLDDAAFLADRGVPVVVAAARREVAEAATDDPRLGVLRLPSGDGPLGPWRLWRAARRGLPGLLGPGPRPAVAQVVVCDAPAIAFAWHLARSEPGLPMRWCVERNVHPQPSPDRRVGVRGAVR